MRVVVVPVSVGVEAVVTVVWFEVEISFLVELLVGNSVKVVQETGLVHTGKCGKLTHKALVLQDTDIEPSFVDEVAGVVTPVEDVDSVETPVLAVAVLVIVEVSAVTGAELETLVDPVEPLVGNSVKVVQETGLVHTGKCGKLTHKALVLQDTDIEPSFVDEVAGVVTPVEDVDSVETPVLAVAVLVIVEVSAVTGAELETLVDPVEPLVGNSVKVVQETGLVHTGKCGKLTHKALVLHDTDMVAALFAEVSALVVPVGTVDKLFDVVLSMVLVPSLVLVSVISALKVLDGEIVYVEQVIGFEHSGMCG